MQPINKKRLPLKGIIGLSIGCADTYNLACGYCYANAGTYNNEKKQIMNMFGYSKLLDFILELEYPISTITFFGGEPLLGFKYFKAFVEQLEKDYFLKYNLLPKLGIVTNGTLIDEEISIFFQKYFSAVSISIDGPKHICDSTRISVNAQESVYDKIKSGLQLLNKTRNREYNLMAISTLIPQTLREVKKIGYKDFQQHFLDLGFDNVSIFMASGVKWNSDDIEEIYILIEEIVDETFNTMIGGGTIKKLDSFVIGFISDIVHKHYNGDCVAGKNYFYYTVEGEFYPCQMYYMARRNEVKAIARYKIEECRQCVAINVCQGHCGGSSLIESGSENNPVKYHCLTQRKMLEYVVQRLGYYYFRKDISKEWSNIVESIINYSKENARSKLIKSSVF